MRNIESCEFVLLSLFHGPVDRFNCDGMIERPRLGVDRFGATPAVGGREQGVIKREHKFSPSDRGQVGLEPRVRRGDSRS